jgi:hypothetical protein
MKTREWLLGGLLVVLGACASAGAEEKVRHQAGYDLQCDEASIELTKISDDHKFMGVKNATWGARGCERQASYKTSCGLGSCTVLTQSQAADIAH